MKNQPIGFIDSGVGGLSVVKEVFKQLPNETVYFIGDSARNPYGSRTMAEVLEFSRELAHFLVNKGIKMLVIACNTATVASLDVLKEELDIPVIGVIEPCSKGAIHTTKNQKIGVIATTGTIQSKEYNKKIEALNSAVEVQGLACQSFVTIVEENRLTDEEIKEEVAENLSAFQRFEMDTLVLGCTHFPLLASYIQEYVGENVQLVDPGYETTKRIKNFLMENDLANPGITQSKKHIFYTTGSVDKFKEIANSWIEDELFEVKSVSLEELEK